MRIDHLAIWTLELEKMKDFYMKYFNMSCGEKYENPRKKFSSYFLTFENSRTRIELMHKPGLTNKENESENVWGLCHFAILLESREKVDELTKQLGDDGYCVVGKPRITGDGYYESIIEDCEGNQVELTAL